jgi:hypothetical protein
LQRPGEVLESGEKEWPLQEDAIIHTFLEKSR